MRILISPLDWGLGHATRCVPIIRALQQNGHEVMIYASGAGRRLLQGEFPGLEIGESPSYSIRYSKSRVLLPFWLLVQLPFFLGSIFSERLRIRRLVRDHAIDLVISDSRYGLKTKSIPCIFITHQLRILPPGPKWLSSSLLKPVAGLNRRVLAGFAEVWVPDFPGAVNLSGKLGHPDPIWPNVRYIHPLCRFRSETLSWNRPAEVNDSGLNIDILALISGPEPQRTMLEEKLMRELGKMSGTRVLIRGLPVGAIHPSTALRDHEFSLPAIKTNQINVFDHLSGDQLTGFLAVANQIVCRSGYTSVMELAGLGKRNVLMIPTPGQPEQEYLGEHLQSMGLAVCQDQEGLNLEAGFRKAADLPGFAVLFRMRDSSAAATDLTGWIREHPLFVL